MSPQLLALEDFNSLFENILTRVVLNNKTSITIVSLSQVVTDPCHAAKLSLDFVFSARQDVGNLCAEGLSVFLLSSTDHYFVMFGFTGLWKL